MLWALRGRTPGPGNGGDARDDTSQEILVQRRLTS